jgi:pimeloyl-CoA synthetase
MNKLKEVDLRNFQPRQIRNSIMTVKTQIQTKVFDFSSKHLSTTQKIDLFRVSIEEINKNYKQVYYLGIDLIENSVKELDETKLKIVVEGLKILKNISDYAFDEDTKKVHDLNIAIAAFLYKE